jgi:hypothetical protein
MAEEVKSQPSQPEISYEVKGRQVLVKMPKVKPLPRKIRKDKGKLVVTPKMELFLKEYEANGGNGTEAALKVFHNSSRVSAANTASIYLKRAAYLGRFHMEKKGLTYSKLIDKAIQRMDNPKSMDFVPLFDRMMKIAGYEDFLSKQGLTKATVNVLNVQKKLMDEYVDGEVIEDEETEASGED